MSDLFEAIRGRTAEVVARARSVRIDPAKLEALAAELATGTAAPPAWDAETHHAGAAESRLAYVVTLDAINFGSGWFPKLRKRGGRSGYYTVAMGLKDRFDAAGPWDAKQLAALGPADVARVLGQDATDADVAELMALFTRALNDLGLLLEGNHGGSFAALVESAGGSAGRLVRELARMPLYRDVARYLQLFEVPFYKRAQITASDLALAFEGEGWGRFEDLDRLTLFADNLVPHVLRLEGVLLYAPELARRIDAGELLASGSPEEIEIRAAAVQAVERIVAAQRAAGVEATAHAVDHLLWHRGRSPEVKARPRHRSRNTFY